jgi:hypothetical protein
MALPEMRECARVHGREFNLYARAFNRCTVFGRFNRFNARPRANWMYARINYVCS